MRELIGQDFDIEEDGVPRLHRGTRSDRIISTVDTEMRHGRKSSQTCFDGYKLSATTTNSAEPLITAVHVAPGGQTDGPQAKYLIDAQRPEHRPSRVLGDTAYGNGPVRAELAERNVQVLAPVRKGKAVEDRFGKHDFAIDPENGTVSCPAGHTVQIGVSAKGFRQAGFSAKLCGAYPLKARCCPGRARRQVKLGEHDDLLLQARRALADPDTAEHLRRKRPGIERLLGLVAHRYRARKSRYIGPPPAQADTHTPTARPPTPQDHPSQNSLLQGSSSIPRR